MKVLWVGHNLAYPPVRGVLQRNFNLLRQAAKVSELHVLAFDQPATRPPGISAEDCANVLRDFCAHVEYVPLSSGIASSRYAIGLRGLFSPNAYDVNWLASREMTLRLREMLNQTKFDTVHFDTLGLAQYRVLVNGAGAVLNHHNIESAMMEQRAATEDRFALRHYWRWEAKKLLLAERKYCPRFAVNLVVSAEDGHLLAERAPGVRTQVVANGVDTDYFTPRKDPGGSSLLFCGGLDWYPNSDAMSYFFDQIWPRLARQLPNTTVSVVGRNPPVWLRRLADSDRRIEVTGFVDDVRPYFTAATAYICPIRVGGGTRLKILDALAMGMPLVGTTFACSGISVKDGKHVLLADSPGTFVDQICRVLADPALRLSLASNGRELVCGEYSWPVIGRSILQAYTKAASMEEARQIQLGLR